MRSVRWIFAVVVLLVWAGVGSSVQAWSTGVTTYSGQFGTICNVCHSGGTVPVVTLTGPANVAPGTISTYTLTIDVPASTTTNQRAGGLDVSADGGVLFATDPGTQIPGGTVEITHTAPRTMNASREVIFTFDWEAPLSAGSYTLFGAGNAVNLAEANLGDAANSTSLIVDVAGATATPGEASGDTLAQMLVTGYDPISGDLSITYDNGCEATDNAIYSGPLAQVANYGYDDEECNIGTSGSFTTFNPSQDSVFFVIVGSKGVDEGSYGRSLDLGGTETERPPFAANLCSQVQTLADRCD